MFISLYFADVGIQWNNIGTPASVDDDFTFGTALLMLLFDSFVCLLIAWYVEAINPGDEGVAQPWYFPFTVRTNISYWFKILIARIVGVILVRKKAERNNNGRLE